MLIVVHLMNPIANVFRRYATKLESRYPKTYKVFTQLKKGSSSSSSEAI